MVRLYSLALLALLALAGPVQSATWTVDPGGTGDATTIQGAVDLAANNDEILVLPGTYPEEVALDKSLAIRGTAGRDFTTVTASETRAYCFRSVGTLGSTIIDGLTLTGVNGGYGFCTGRSAVDIAGPVTMNECRVENNLCPETPVNVVGSLTLNSVEFLNNIGIGAICGAPEPQYGVGAIRALGLFAIDCTFEGNYGSSTSLLDIQGGTADLVLCEFRDNGNVMFISTVGPGSVGLFSGLFVGNPAPLVMESIWGAEGFPLVVEVRNNTFVDNPYLFDLVGLGYAPGSLFDANVFTGGGVGLALPDGGVGMTATCNDAWDNDQDFVGFDPGPGGNFSLDPLYCDPAQGVYTVAANSPLLEANNACGTLIGAFGQGCGPVSIEAASWAKVKSLYR